VTPPETPPETAAPGRVALAAYTTLGLGGPATVFSAASTEAELVAAVQDADSRAEPLLLLGGGSNIVVSDQGFAGTVIRVATRGIQFTREPEGVTVTVAAGENWDGVVSRCLQEGLAGLECLSGIPGLAGATPIQNVGAYGQEVAETIRTVTVFDRGTRKIINIPNELCGFSYRTSTFKRGDVSFPGVTSRFVVLSVTFRLSASPLSEPVRYTELAAALGVAPGERVTTGEARSGVLKLRAAKGMLVNPDDPDSRSAGSFFTNPVLDAGQLVALEAAVRARYGADVRVPSFPSADGQVKVSAAWLIEQAGFHKGYPGHAGGARLSAKHTLALVNAGGATTADLIALAREVADGVRDAFGVDLAPEPVLVGVTL